MRARSPRSPQAQNTFREGPGPMRTQWAEHKGLAQDPRPASAGRGLAERSRALLGERSPRARGAPVTAPQLPVTDDGNSCPYSGMTPRTQAFARPPIDPNQHAAAAAPRPMGRRAEPKIYTPSHAPTQPVPAGSAPVSSTNYEPRTQYRLARSIDCSPESSRILQHVAARQHAPRPAPPAGQRSARDGRRRVGVGAPHIRDRVDAPVAVAQVGRDR